MIQLIGVQSLARLARQPAIWPQYARAEPQAAEERDENQTERRQRHEQLRQGEAVATVCRLAPGSPF